MPIYRRLPKRGFVNIFAKDYNIVSVGRLQVAIDAGKLDATSLVTVESLRAAGIVRRIKDGVRLLADGDLKAKLELEIAGASKGAVAKVEAVGGSVKILTATR